MSSRRTGSKNESWDWKDTGEKIAMGERVGAILSALQETACVHIEEREIIAIIKMYARLFPDDKDFVEYLTNQATPAFKDLGYGRWYRDVITDLALALAKTKRKSKTRSSAKNILEK